MKKPSRRGEFKRHEDEKSISEFVASGVIVIIIILALVIASTVNFIDTLIVTVTLENGIITEANFYPEKTATIPFYSGKFLSTNNPLGDNPVIITVERNGEIIFNETYLLAKNGNFTIKTHHKIESGDFAEIEDVNTRTFRGIRLP